MLLWEGTAGVQLVQQHAWLCTAVLLCRTEPCRNLGKRKVGLLWNHTVIPHLQLLRLWITTKSQHMDTHNGTQLPFLQLHKGTLQQKLCLLGMP